MAFIIPHIPQAVLYSGWIVQSALEIKYRKDSEVQDQTYHIQE